MTTLRSKDAFLDSSAVEHSAVNRRVVGSNPTRGVNETKFYQNAKRRHSRKTKIVSQIKNFQGTENTIRGIERYKRVRFTENRKAVDELWLRGQAVKTSPFHGGNTGSIPVGVIFYNDRIVVI